MAERDEEEKDEKKEKKEKPKSPIVMILIVFVISILLGGGGVFVWFKFSSSPHDGSRATATIMEESSDAMDTVGTMLPLETFIVNLADEEGSKYLKITIELEVESEKVLEEINNKMARIRDSLLILLSSKDFLSIRTVEGKFKLRDEIISRVNSVLRTGKVRTAYFTDLVIQ